MSSGSIDSEDSKRCRAVILPGTKITCVDPLTQDFAVIEFGAELGSGKTSTIYHCGDTSVAKAFSSLYRSEFCDEMVIMCKIRQLDEASRKYLAEALYSAVWMRFDLAEEYTYYHPIIVMPRYYEDLDVLINTLGGCDLATTRRIMRQILSALGVLHSLGFVHADVKPENIFLTRPLSECENHTVEIKLGDFGHSLRQCDDLNKEYECEMPGTTAYSSPETIYALAYFEKNGKNPAIPVGPERDVWSCGCIAFELLTNMQLFTGGNYDFARILGQMSDYLGIFNGELPHFAELRQLTELESEITGGKTTIVNLMEKYMDPKERTILAFLKATLAFSGRVNTADALALL